MRLLRASCHNFGPLRDVAIDFAALGPGIIAVCGKIGSGKSHLMSAIGPAGWYQSDGYYGDSLWRHFVGSGFLESVYDFDGTEVTFKLEADKSGEVRRAYVEVAGQKPAGPNLTPALKLAAEYVPSPLLTYATIVAAQGNGGSIFKLKEAERRKLLIEMLGLDVYERRVALFGTLQRARKEAAGTLAADAQTARATLERAEHLQRIVAQDGQRARELRERLNELEYSLASERITLITLREAAAADAATRAALTQERTALEKQIRELDTAIGEVDTDLPPIDPDAVERLGGEVATLQQRISEHEQRTAPIMAELDRISALLLADEEQGATNRTEIDEATKEAEALRERYRERKTSLSRLAEALVSGVDLSVPMCQACPLTAEGRNAQQGLADNESGYRTALGTLNAKISAATDAQMALAVVQAEHAEQQSLVADRLVPEQTRLEELRTVLATAQGSLQEAVTLAQRSQAALAAAGRLQHLSAQRRDASEALSALEGRVAAVDAAAGQREELAAAERQFGDAEGRVRTVREELGTCERAVAMAEGQLVEIGDAAATVAQAEQAAQRARSDATDYGTLKAAWEQVRWALIDDACPSIEALTNDLLAGFDDGRFRVELPTATEKRTGGEKDGLVPRVIDTRADATREQVSGGETGICDEALRGGIGIYRANRLGLRTETLFRDEPTSPLGDASAFYIQMLRRLWERAGAYQLIVATHDQDAIAAADRRLVLADGRVTIQ